MAELTYREIIRVRVPSLYSLVLSAICGTGRINVDLNLVLLS
jgi:hypothetical protein